MRKIFVYLHGKGNGESVAVEKLIAWPDIIFRSFFSSIPRVKGGLRQMNVVNGVLADISEVLSRGETVAREELLSNKEV
jgi:hypothetical protein